jgi:hypothetical protein
MTRSWPSKAKTSNRKEADMERTVLSLALLTLLLGAMAWPAMAQVRPGGAVEEELLSRATTYDPERVRALMLSIHGYTYAALESVSTDVPRILMMLAGDDRELMVVRRQAVKGLKLYPQADVLTFIENQVGRVPEPLRRLYLGTLGGFALGFPDRVSAIAETYLNDPELLVRYAALTLAGQLEPSPRVRSILETSLEREQDATLRSAIRKQLNAE